jgi:hypothetical protein
LKAIEASAVTPPENVAVTRAGVGFPSARSSLVGHVSVGVPDMVPVVGLIIRPVGSAPKSKEGLLLVGTIVKVIGAIAEPTAPFTLL